MMSAPFQVLYSIVVLIDWEVYYIYNIKDKKICKKVSILLGY